MLTEDMSYMQQVFQSICCPSSMLFNFILQLYRLTFSPSASTIFEFPPLLLFREQQSIFKAFEIKSTIKIKLIYAIKGNISSDPCEHTMGHAHVHHSTLAHSNNHRNNGNAQVNLPYLIEGSEQKYVEKESK